MEQKHDANCQCTYCDEKIQDAFKTILHQPQFGDNDALGKVKPEVYTFVEQTKESVKQILEMSEKAIPFTKELLADSVKAERAYPTPKDEPKLLYESVECQTDFATSQKLAGLSKAEQDYPTPKAGKLLYEDESYVSMPDIRADKSHKDDEPCLVSDEIGATWRKLAGVSTEKVYEDEVVIAAMQCVADLLAAKFPKMEIGWSDECWNRHLELNGARTRFTSANILMAYDGLKCLIGEEPAMQVVASEIAKKVESLFI